MGEVRVHNTIDASPDQVWSVLSDVGRWAEWNEVIVDGRCDRGEVGAVLSCRVAVGPTWFPVKSRLVSWTPGESLIWGEDRGWLARIHHGFSLKAEGGRTRVDHFERFGGLIGRAVFPAVRGSLTRNYARFLESLKDRVEREAR
ncbi:MAG: SRPBCC domain-containing protein [Alphaproteobacteria bacterium]|nr:SRPBCC domain-containing protein [Alphaproteobacteria bacterium]MCB9700037.1 SRPBCC domain-containing protein [Alphaproteobacteria bacterium]